MMIITIDGPAAAGKGTLAANLAKKYELSHFDTGMVYRATGVLMYIAGADVNNEDEAEKFAKKLTYADMMELSKHPEFRSPIGGDYASRVSAHPKVRSALLKMQQDFSKRPTYADGSPAKGAIYDGRDTGTKVCPHADYKFFLTASSEERARRRHREFEIKGIIMPYEKVLADIIERDLRDSTRAADPLKPAEGACIIDTTEMTIPDVFAKAVEFVEKK